MKKRLRKIHRAPDLHHAESVPIAGFRLISAKTSTPEIVSFSGSFLCGTAHDRTRKGIITQVLAEMLLEGTKKRDTRAFNQALEEIGATLSFAATSTRITFEAICLARYAPVLIELLAEALREPALHSRSLGAVKKRLFGELRLEEDDMKSTAKVAWTRLVYPPSHPHYEPTVAERKEQLRLLRKGELTAFHLAYFGVGSLVLSAAGAVDAKVLRREVVKHFSGWRRIPTSQTTLLQPKARVMPRAMRILSVREKASVDMFLGSSLTLTKRSPDYYPLLVGLSVLGARGFTGRLFQIVREKLGLTYGIYALPGGFEEQLRGYWYISATFAPALFASGLAATKRELSRFLKGGPTAREIADQKHIISSHYLLSLASSRGVALVVRLLAEERAERVDLDLFLRRIESVTPQQVRASLQHLRVARRSLSAAGSISGKGEPIGRG